MVAGRLDTSNAISLSGSQPGSGRTSWRPRMADAAWNPRRRASFKRTVARVCAPAEVSGPAGCHRPASPRAALYPWDRGLSGTRFRQ
jgi:hypothetical protein